MPSKPRIPSVAHGDSYSLGQLTQMWGKTSAFVHGVVTQGLITKDECGLVTNAELNRFYKDSGTLLDG